MIPAAVLLVLSLLRPTDLTYVRHAETLANATGRYSARTLDTFSSKGNAEIAQLTAQLLKEPRFDVILVSPSPRALKTIAPYLAASHQTATVWPLLYECCTGRRPKGAHATRFVWGPKVTVGRSLARWFVVPAGSRFPVAGNYNAGLAQVGAALGEFRSKYLGRRILLVGHSAMGGQFLHALAGKWIEVKNATEIKLLLG